MALQTWVLLLPVDIDVFVYCIPFALVHIPSLVAISGGLCVVLKGRRLNCLLCLPGIG
jgi:hypothetical protein